MEYSKQTNERSTPFNMSKKKGAQFRNQNAVDNKGGNVPKGNEHAVTSVLF